MHTAYGFSRSAGAAVSLARAKAMGMGGRGCHSISSSVGVRQLSDEMFEAFCLVCESPEQGENQNRQAGSPHDNLFRFLERYPWMLDKYPWVLDRYPWMFSQARVNNGNQNTLH